MILASSKSVQPLVFSVTVLHSGGGGTVDLILMLRYGSEPGLGSKCGAMPDTSADIYSNVWPYRRAVAPLMLMINIFMKQHKLAPLQFFEVDDRTQKIHSYLQLQPSCSVQTADPTETLGKIA